ncbi:hypothetical protein MJN51_34850, partial [Salmonella enterica subsp. enterica serovar Kentucky]|nr:hypothetical protein [Salmonella enterica subsp. enterica serovar Kentucky]
RKGLTPWETTFCYAEHKARQFDLLAEAMRQHIDIDKIYTIMQLMTVNVMARREKNSIWRCW